MHVIVCLLTRGAPRLESIFRNLFLSTLVFTYFKCLYFSYSSILQFGRGT